MESTFVAVLIIDGSAGNCLSSSAPALLCPAATVLTLRRAAQSTAFGPFPGMECTHDCDLPEPESQPEPWTGDEQIVCEMDACGVCDGDGGSCEDCAGSRHGAARRDRCGACDDDPANDCRLDCLGVWGGNQTLDDCGVCGGDGASCRDCGGDIGGHRAADHCGVCNGSPADDCGMDCLGVWGGTSVFDACGVCGGDGGSCADCAGEAGGTRVLDECGVCDSSPGNDCGKDCAGVWGGTAALDSCGVCDGIVTSGPVCLDCAGAVFGSSVEDRCLTCDTDASNDCAADCLGVWGGNATLDTCGVCGGDDSSCEDCAGVPSGGSRLDRCGTCDADTSNDCVMDCDGVWGGQAMVDMRAAAVGTARVTGFVSAGQFADAVEVVADGPSVTRLVPALDPVVSVTGYKQVLYIGVRAPGEVVDYENITAATRLPAARYAWAAAIGGAITRSGGPTMKAVPAEAVNITDVIELVWETFRQWVEIRYRIEAQEDVSRIFRNVSFPQDLTLSIIRELRQADLLDMFPGLDNLACFEPSAESLIDYTVTARLPCHHADFEHVCKADPFEVQLSAAVDVGTPWITCDRDNDPLAHERLIGLAEWDDRNPCPSVMDELLDAGLDCREGWPALFQDQVERALLEAFGIADGADLNVTSYASIDDHSTEDCYYYGGSILGRPIVPGSRRQSVTAFTVRTDRNISRELAAYWAYWSPTGAAGGTEIAGKIVDALNRHSGVAVPEIAPDQAQLNAHFQDGASLMHHIVYNVYVPDRLNNDTKVYFADEVIGRLSQRSLVATALVLDANVEVDPSFRPLAECGQTFDGPDFLEGRPLFGTWGGEYGPIEEPQARLHSMVQVQGFMTPEQFLLAISTLGRFGNESIEIISWNVTMVGSVTLPGAAQGTISDWCPRSCYSRCTANKVLITLSPDESPDPIATEHGCRCREASKRPDNSTFAGCPASEGWCDVLPGCAEARNTTSSYDGWDECSLPAPSTGQCSTTGHNTAAVCHSHGNCSDGSTNVTQTNCITTGVCSDGNVGISRHHCVEAVCVEERTVPTQFECQIIKGYTWVPADTYTFEPFTFSPFAFTPVLQVHIRTTSWAVDVRWQIDDGPTFGPYENHGDYYHTVQLAPGRRTFRALDASGDGWHGGFFELKVGPRWIVRPTWVTGGIFELSFTMPAGPIDSAWPGSSPGHPWVIADNPVPWRDNGDLVCRDYATAQYCSGGGLGAAWRDEYGTLADYAGYGSYVDHGFEGQVDAGMICCVCGGGYSSGSAPCQDFVQQDTVLLPLYSTPGAVERQSDTAFNVDTVSWPDINVTVAVSTPVVGCQLPAAGTSAHDVMSACTPRDACEDPCAAAGGGFVMCATGMCVPRSECMDTCSQWLGEHFVLCSTLVKECPVMDECMVCSGDNDCQDCSNSTYGGAFSDECDNCVSSTQAACTLDCLGVWGGGAVLDECGVCAGDGSSCFDCANVTNGDSKVDRCGTCDASVANDCRPDCAGVWGGSAAMDICGVCGGDGSSCVDCRGLRNGPHKRDNCGHCDADPRTDCDPDCGGVWGGDATPDLCGACSGPTDACFDCAGVHYGASIVDACGRCVDPFENTSLPDCSQDCAQNWRTNHTTSPVVDRCGVCGGNGTSCLDCLGIPHGQAVRDRCLTCDSNATNDCKQDCAGTWGGNLTLDECFVCGGANVLCADCAGVPNGDFVNDRCLRCDNDPSNDCVQDCADTWGGSLTVDLCGVCGGNLSTCADCAGVPYGLSSMDRCEQCDLDPANDCVQDCASVWGGAATLDICSVCDGDGTSCLDCAGVPFGNNTLDECLVCDGDLQNDCEQDCLLVWGGDTKIDACGECGGGNVSCTDCSGELFGIREEDECGTCDALYWNDCKMDCFGVWGGPAGIDFCGVCAGDNSTCIDCANVPDGDSVVDQCGHCDNDFDNDCPIDCLAVWGGSATDDVCGVCNGTLSMCADCAGAGYGDSWIDRCGNCTAAAEQGCSLDCTGVWGGPAEVDSCGVCGGLDARCDRATVIWNSSLTVSGRVAEPVFVAALADVFATHITSPANFSLLSAAIRYVTAAEVRVFGTVRNFGMRGGSHLDAIVAQQVQLQFRQGLSDMTGIPTGAISIASIGDARRRLQDTWVLVQYEVRTTTDIYDSFLGERFSQELAHAINNAGIAVPAISEDERGLTLESVSVTTTLDFSVSIWEGRRANLAALLADLKTGVSLIGAMATYTAGDRACAAVGTCRGSADTVPAQCTGTAALVPASCTGIATTVVGSVANCSGTATPVAACSGPEDACQAVGMVWCGITANVDACVPHGTAAPNCVAAFADAPDTLAGSCPAGCSYTAAVPDSRPLCDLDLGTDPVHGQCPAGCSFADARTPMCDLDGLTDGSAACAAGCLYRPAITPTCDLDESTDGSGQCPAGCSTAGLVSCRTLGSGANTICVPATSRCPAGMSTGDPPSAVLNSTNTEDVVATLDCFGVTGGPAELDACGVCGGQDDTCLDCAGAIFGNSTTDRCGVCDNIAGNDCVLDCSGVWGGSALPNECGVCGGKDVAVCFEWGCDGLRGSGAVADLCGVCGGNGSSCLDCAGRRLGDVGCLSLMDHCGTCDCEPSNDCDLDCLGVWGGAAVLDECAVCDGDGTTCLNSSIAIEFQAVLETPRSYQQPSVGATLRADWHDRLPNSFLRGFMGHYGMDWTAGAPILNATAEPDPIAPVVQQQVRSHYGQQIFVDMRLPGTTAPSRSDFYYGSANEVGLLAQTFFLHGMANVTGLPLSAMRIVSLRDDWSSVGSEEDRYFDWVIVRFEIVSSCGWECSLVDGANCDSDVADSACMDPCVALAGDFVQCPPSAGCVPRGDCVDMCVEPHKRRDCNSPTELSEDLSAIFRQSSLADRLRPAIHWAQVATHPNKTRLPGVDHLQLWDPVVRNTIDMSMRTVLPCDEYDPSIFCHWVRNDIAVAPRLAAMGPTRYGHVGGTPMSAMFSRSDPWLVCADDVDLQGDWLTPDGCKAAVSKILSAMETTADGTPIRSVGLNCSSTWLDVYLWQLRRDFASVLEVATTATYSSTADATQATEGPALFALSATASSVDGENPDLVTMLLRGHTAASWKESLTTALNSGPAIPPVGLFVPSSPPTATYVAEFSGVNFPMLTAMDAIDALRDHSAVKAAAAAAGGTIDHIVYSNPTVAGDVMSPFAMLKYEAKVTGSLTVEQFRRVFWTHSTISDLADISMVSYAVTVDVSAVLPQAAQGTVSDWCPRSCYPCDENYMSLLLSTDARYIDETVVVNDTIFDLCAANATLINTTGILRASLSTMRTRCDRYIELPDDAAERGVRRIEVELTELVFPDTRGAGGNGYYADGGAVSRFDYLSMYAASSDGQWSEVLRWGVTNMGGAETLTGSYSFFGTSFFIRFETNNNDYSTRGFTARIHMRPPPPPPPPRADYSPFHVIPFPTNPAVSTWVPFDLRVSQAEVLTIDCFGVVDGGAVLDACAVCGGRNESCADCSGEPYGPRHADRCGACDTNYTNDCWTDCAGVWGGNSTIDICGVCGGDSSLCSDCAGVPYGDFRADQCGICDDTTDNDCVRDCETVWGGGLMFDDCGVCGGDNASCTDCAGVPNGAAYLDNCTVCDDNRTNDCPLDCRGVWGGGLEIDMCGVCGGIDACAGCDGVAYSGVAIDRCGVCGGNNTCLGCDDVPFSGLVEDDVCGLCGSGVRIMDFFAPPVDGLIGIPSGPHLGVDTITECARLCFDALGANCTALVFDISYQCYFGLSGDPTAMGPWPRFFSLRRLSYEELPAGDGAPPGIRWPGCAGCDAVPRSGLLFDACGICDGDNSTCLGCDGVPNSGLVNDTCSVCGGDNSTCRFDEYPHICSVQEYETVAPINDCSVTLRAVYTWCASDRECDTLTNCTALEYESVAPTASSDRVCLNITTTCGNATGVVPGAGMDLGQYMEAPENRTSDRLCRNLTICQDDEWESVPPTIVSDRVCLPLTGCAYNEYQTVAATATTPNVCTLLTVCTNDEYEIVAATYYTDRECAPLTVCGAGQFLAVVATATRDNVCQDFTVCGQYEMETVAPTPISDRVCKSTRCVFSRHGEDEGNFTFVWSFPSYDEIEAEFEIPGSSYVGLGLGASQMANSDMVIGWVNSDGSYFVGDFYSTGYITPEQDSQGDLNDTSAQYFEGRTRIGFRRKLFTEDERDADLEVGPINLIYSWGGAVLRPARATHLIYHTNKQREQVIGELDLADCWYFDVAPPNPPEQRCKVGENPCDPNHATCRDKAGVITCTCHYGYETENAGLNCTNIDDCAALPCQHNGECSDEVLGYRCACVSGYTGQICELDVDECESTPCQNGADCIEGVDQFVCECADGWSGSACTVDIDECWSAPCQHGGSCADGVDSYACTCENGYNGTNCAENIDDCGPNPCLSNGTCYDRVANFTCACVSGFSGRTCEHEVDACDAATNICDQQHAQCINRGPGDSICLCYPGYETADSGVTCTEVDECASTPCRNGATCSDRLEAYTCLCASGFRGDVCENDVDECASEPCAHGSTCTQPAAAAYVCDCVSGWAGDNCDENVDDCESIPCQQGSRCTDGFDSYACSCVSGFTGFNCGTDIDECAATPCENGGNCTDGIAAFSCTCLTGFAGPNCAEVDDPDPPPPSSGLVSVDITFDTELGSLDPATFSAAAIADLADLLDLDPSEIEFVGLTAGSVVLTVQLPPDAYARLLATFNAGTLGTVAAHNVLQVAMADTPAAPEPEPEPEPAPEPAFVAPNGGCTSRQAANYNPESEWDDGSCIYCWSFWEGNSCLANGCQWVPELSLCDLPCTLANCWQCYTVDTCAVAECQWVDFLDSCDQPCSSVDCWACYSEEDCEEQRACDWMLDGVAGEYCDAGIPEPQPEPQPEPEPLPEPYLGWSALAGMELQMSSFAGFDAAQVAATLAATFESLLSYHPFDFNSGLIGGGAAVNCSTTACGCLDPSAVNYDPGHAVDPHDACYYTGPFTKWGKPLSVDDWLDRIVVDNFQYSVLLAVEIRGAALQHFTPTVRARITYFLTSHYALAPEDVELELFAMHSRRALQSGIASTRLLVTASVASTAAGEALLAIWQADTQAPSGAFYSWLLRGLGSGLPVSAVVVQHMKGAVNFDMEIFAQTQPESSEIVRVVLTIVSDGTLGATLQSNMGLADAFVIVREMSIVTPEMRPDFDPENPPAGYVPPDPEPAPEPEPEPEPELVPEPPPEPEPPEPEPEPDPHIGSLADPPEEDGAGIGGSIVVVLILVVVAVLVVVVYRRQGTLAQLSVGAFRGRKDGGYSDSDSEWTMDGESSKPSADQKIWKQERGRWCERCCRRSRNKIYIAKDDAVKADKLRHVAGKLGLERGATSVRGAGLFGVLAEIDRLVEDAREARQPELNRLQALDDRGVSGGQSPGAADSPGAAGSPASLGGGSPPLVPRPRSAGSSRPSSSGGRSSQIAPSGYEPPAHRRLALLPNNMMRSLLDSYGDVDHEDGDDARTANANAVEARLEKMEKEVEAERADRERNKARLARIQKNYDEWTSRAADRAQPSQEEAEEQEETAAGPKRQLAAKGSDEWWEASGNLDVGAAAVAEGRFADGIAAFRLGLAAEQGDAELSDKLRDGLAWAKLRLAAERRKQNAEGTD